MKKSLMLAACLAFAMSGAVYATPGNSGSGKGGCGNGQQTNGCGGSDVIGGAGGSVVGSGNSANLNANLNSNKNHNTNVNANSNRNSNHNNNINKNTNMQGQGQAQGQIQGQAQGQGQSQSTNNANNSTQAVTVQGDNYEAARIPVATAYAPNIMPTAVCMGSSSVGGQGMTFGVSVGSSWTDSNCMLLEQVRTVSTVLNDPITAAQMLCSVKEYAKARAEVGKPCGNIQQVSQTNTQVATASKKEVTVQELAVGYTGNDPIVRKRLGLPPLN